MEVASHPDQQGRRRLLSLIVFAAAVVLAALLPTHGILGEAGSSAALAAVPQQQTLPFRWG